MIWQYDGEFFRFGRFGIHLNSFRVWFGRYRIKNGEEVLVSYKYITRGQFRLLLRSKAGKISSLFNKFPRTEVWCETFPIDWASRKAMSLEIHSFNGGIALEDMHGAELLD